MDSCPASNTMYYNIGSKGARLKGKENRNRKEGKERGKKRIGSRMITKKKNSDHGLVKRPDLHNPEGWHNPG